jgi:hypothetical protein
VLITSCLCRLQQLRHSSRPKGGAGDWPNHSRACDHIRRLLRRDPRRDLGDTDLYQRHLSTDWRIATCILTLATLECTRSSVVQFWLAWQA